MKEAQRPTGPSRKLTARLVSDWALVPFFRHVTHRPGGPRDAHGGGAGGTARRTAPAQRAEPARPRRPGRSPGRPARTRPPPGRGAAARGGLGTRRRQPPERRRVHLRADPGHPRLGPGRPAEPRRPGVRRQRGAVPQASRSGDLRGGRRRGAAGGPGAARVALTGARRPARRAAPRRPAHRRPDGRTAEPPHAAGPGGGPATARWCCTCTA